MTTSLVFRMAAQNLRRYWRKSLSTLLVMAVGILACNVLYGYVDATLDLTSEAFTRWGARGQLMIESPVAEGAAQEDAAKVLLTEEAQRTIDSVLGETQGVMAYARLLEISGLVSDGRTNAIFTGIGQDVEKIRAIKGPEYEYDVVAGKPLWATAGTPSMIVGQELARTLSCKVPDVGFSPTKPGEKPEERPFECDRPDFQLSVVTNEGQINAVSFPATGVMDWGIKEINQRLVVLPMKDAQELMNTQSVSKYHVRLADGVSMEDAREKLMKAFEAKGLKVRVFYWSDRATFYHQVYGLLMGFFGFVLAITLVVSFMSLLNTSYVNFMGRIREFGTLRSMGFSKEFVLSLCWVESLLLALVAGAMGLLASAAVTLSVRMAGLSWVPPGSSNAVPITISWSAPAYTLSIAVLAVVAVGASAIPALKSTRKTIREALSDL
ncbi:ABC transporter permease [Stigmatella aurantiaca]|uniref:Efflux ABC transporter, permease protein n=2 Tax=Stigmatella aurantiaca (strain DW4/3-1) TaxID=378806 RepID=E3FWW7_STIAD|nr:FtsX-like permease family protein [Stigmatella aurantiaca]ADO71018.1 Efflux ABC transporter, permease protein [Stigmatella aurantiaca DW4/3-1]